MSYHGLQLALRAFTGGNAFRVVHPGHQRIAEHHHEWMCLDVYMLGSYTERHDGAQVWIDGPAVVLHPPREPHANTVEGAGLEAIGIQLELDWLRWVGFNPRFSGPRCWIGGQTALAAHQLACVWSSPLYSERDVARATTLFLERALDARDATSQPAPSWLARVTRSLSLETPPRTVDLARMCNLHPAWLARSYRATVGEGIQDTVRRKRVERATALLRNSDRPLAQIAADAGFCDQSHMNRAFRAVMQRTPIQVRAERESLRVFDVA
jgi:AraC family transcriptional regulator